MLEYLLQAGGNVDAVSLSGETGLHEAARYGQDACCRLLMRRGASLSLLNSEDQTPADVAQQNSHERTAEILSPDPKAVEKQRHVKVSFRILASCVNL